ncbi:MAG: VRR-NUC domain-containing protein [Bacteroides uniformis]|nr:VRR-NUC domain-containing protein [Bacteroides uniformis]
MNEKLIEKKLREGVRALGGVALKFSSPYHRGVPDRIVLMPGGRIYFVELKSTGKKPTFLQEKAMEELRKLGFDVRVTDNQESLDEFLGEVSHE